jgi:hypothetical protein
MGGETKNATGIFASRANEQKPAKDLFTAYTKFFFWVRLYFSHEAPPQRSTATFAVIYSGFSHCGLSNPM